MVNLIALALVAVAALACCGLTGDAPQWPPTGSASTRSSPGSSRSSTAIRATHRLIWGTPATIILAVAFGSISFVTYAVSFWGPPYVAAHFLLRRRPTRPLSSTGMTAAKEVVVDHRLGRGGRRPRPA